LTAASKFGQDKYKKTQKVLDVVLKIREINCILELMRKIKFCHQLSVP
jgi:hypothetical protein